MMKSKPPEQAPFDTAMQLRISQLQKDRFAAAARRRHLPLTTWMRQACEDAIARMDQEVDDGNANAA